MKQKPHAQAEQSKECMEYCPSAGRCSATSREAGLITCQFLGKKNASIPSVPVNAMKVILEDNFILTSRGNAAPLRVYAGGVLLMSEGVWLVEDLQAWQEVVFEHSYALLIKCR